MQKIKDKKGAGLVTNLIAGVGGLVITVVIILVITSTILDANLLTGGSAEAQAASNLSANLSSGINNVAEKIPTILLVAAVVLLLGVLVFLVAQARRANLGGGGI